MVRQSLEAMVQADPLLIVIKKRGLLVTTPLDNDGTTIKYLQKAGIVLSKKGVEVTQFSQEFASFFDINPQTLIDLLANEHHRASAWLYRSYMELARQTLGYEPERFYREVFEETFSDQKQLLLSVARYFSLAEVLKGMKRQNHQWTTLTDVDIKGLGRGHIQLSRKTTPNHRRELEELVGATQTRKILGIDCLSTRTAYQALFDIFGDRRATLHDHTHCEGTGAEQCVYEIEFTPVKIRETAQRLLLKFSSYVIPELARILRERDELKDTVFELEDRIERGTEYVKGIHQSFAAIVEAQRKSGRHGVVNAGSTYSSQVRAREIARSVSYFTNLVTLVPEHPLLAEFFDEISTAIRIKCLRATGGRYDLTELKIQIAGIFDPLMTDPDEKQAEARRRVGEYRRIRDLYLEQASPVIHALLMVEPLNVEAYLAAMGQTSIMGDAFDDFKRKIELQTQRVSLPLEQIIRIAQEEAIAAKGELDLTYQLDGEFSVPNPIRFGTILRDILFNVTDYGGGKATISVAAPPKQRVVALQEKMEITGNCTQYLAIRDSGPGIPPKKVTAINQFLTGREDDIDVSERGTGQGTRDLRAYLTATQQDNSAASAYCLYSSTTGEGTVIEFFFYEKERKE